MDEQQISDVRVKILRKIGKPVVFKDSMYPEGKLRGTLKDRVVMYTRSISQAKDFFDVIDLIEFYVKGQKREAIRFGYYIFNNAKLRWGSQTTLTEEKKILSDLFKKAMCKTWFQKLFE